ncbi:MULTISPECIES: helix-turn-helix domain-containing protein [unclassified Streptomyces]|uniref:helix-turn-helix domain-containing protein n=1 Tax=unclassified Streptomyces TaxID=2593676 RepID=UPI0022AFCD18|nr:MULTISPECIES: helix-turn-helix transcriptional regulator [unclassified Streptomyces]MCZ4097293.1 helix-turn-helix transcriptional regulator [Streptomyces sp. H39-C1]MCZ4120597.1 helix-turn-helix transcriptional regulator [Streptomyces sp. H39-S7]
MSEQPHPVATGEPANGLEWFGREVEEALAHKEGASQRGLAEATGYKEPYVSKVKNGKSMPSPQFAEGCDRYFNTSGWFARILVRISERGHPNWFIPYVNLERDASRVEDYSNAFVMGMLQTHEYAEAGFRATHPRETDDQIKARAEARLRRRDVMLRKDPPLLWVILHESVLRTVVGSPGVMAAQLGHLVAEAATPHITLQVLPFKAGAPASSLPFTLLTPGSGATVLYSETRDQGHVNDSATAVGGAKATYERLRAAALSPDESVTLIRQIAEDHAR